METTRKTYRFKLSSEIVEELCYFSKLHQFDSKSDYKEAWKLWVEEKKDEINRESNRLRSMGYNGNVIQKLYVSARYYYKNKKDKPTEKQKRRKYVGCDEELIVYMDDFIEKNNKKPKDGYDMFIKEMKNNPVVIQQIQEFREGHGLSSEEIETKLKKTFKNRYFLNNK